VPPLTDGKRTELVKALEALEVETFFGRLKFATEGDFYHSNVGLAPLTIQIQDGKVAVVGPMKDPDSKPQYPMTPWTKR
jgi:branched-chain amino acid transport system substrate-binding protein